MPNWDEIDIDAMYRQYIIDWYQAEADHKARMEMLTRERAQMARRLLDSLLLGAAYALVCGLLLAVYSALLYFAYGDERHFVVALVLALGATVGGAYLSSRGTA